MKPLLSALIINDAKPGAEPVWVPFPFPHDKEQIDAILDKLSSPDGVDECRVIRYSSRLGVTPKKDVSWEFVCQVAKWLERFTPAQLKSIKNLCGAFELDFGGIVPFIKNLVHVNDRFMMNKHFKNNYTREIMNE